MMFYSSLLPSFMLLSSLAVAQQSNGPSPTTVSLWLPWLDGAGSNNIQASVINAQTNATTYLLSCPTTTVSSPKNFTDICNLVDSETVTANPTTVVVSATEYGTTFTWDCQYDGTTKPATCMNSLHAANFSSAGTTGFLDAQGESVYPTNSVNLQPVTVTAGNLTAGASTATATASPSGTSAGTSTATPKPSSGGVAVGPRGLGSLAAVGAGFLGLALGMV